MLENQFVDLAEKTIADIAEQIELQDKEYRFEIDMLGDVLSIKTKSGEYILNKHTAAREIWLASPVSGPYHFRFDEGRWVNKAGVELVALLSRELIVFLALDARISRIS
jgi:iron donor protein CyaY